MVKLVVGDQVVRRYNRSVYFICHLVDGGAEMLISRVKDAPVTKCRVCEMPVNLRLANREEILKGCAENF